MSNTYTKLCGFLQTHRAKDTSTTTHVGMQGGMVGKYAIDTETDRAEFLSLYIKALENGDPLTLAESHESIGPVLIDVDLKYDMNAGFERKYTVDDVVRVLDMYRDIMRECLRIDEAKMVAYVFEKHTPRRGQNAIKDGIHIVFPYVVTDPYVQYEMRERLLKRYETMPVFRETRNSARDIFDKAVIFRNSWLMVGSSKSSSAPPYHLSYVFDAKSESLPIPSLAHQVKTCLIRGHTESVPLGPDLTLDGLMEKYGPNDVNTNTPDTGATVLSRYSDMDLDYAAQLVRILDPRRSESYVSWIELGWCLHNISKTFLELWDDFSRQSPKYKPGDCERHWVRFRESGLGIGTLCMWAREDNPDKYFELRTQSETALVEQALTGTHFDVARLVYAKFRSEFVCVSVRDPQVWYHFKDHRWVQTQKGAALRNRVMDELGTTIKTLMIAHSRRMLELRQLGQEDDAKKLEAHLHQYKFLYKELRTRRFVEDVIHVCSDLFLDETFRHRQDMNPYLIGFTNGVLDLEHMLFREGRPDDYVTLTTGYDFHWLHEYYDDPRLVEVKEFTSQVLPDPDIRCYVLTLLSSMMFGKNVEQKVHIWTGAGSNGKSTLVDLYEGALGDYATKLPVSLITGKRTSSSSATPELAKTVGRRFASMQEPESSDRLNVGLIKELSGGDKIVARPLYCEAFEFVPLFKIVLMCNRLPVIPSTDGGTWRRLRVVHFPSKFVDNPTEPNEFQKNRSIGVRMEEWKSVFMAVLVEYFRNHAADLAKGRGVKEPEEVIKYTLAYQRRSNVVLEFVEQTLECTGISRDRVELDLVYSEFKTWYTNAYNRTPMNKNEFRDELNNQRIEVHGAFVTGVRMQTPDHGTDDMDGLV